MLRMPADFRYREVYLKGRPQHAVPDAFSIKHPKMDVLRRAKIFAPFDALKGFDDALCAYARAAEQKMSGTDADEAEE